MFRRLTVATLIGAGALAAIPAAPAEAQMSDRVLILYGEDRCPTSHGEQIVVCVWRDESERYRIPPELRDTRDLAANESWLAQSERIQYVGASGTMSCSPVGAGGFTGCTQEILRAARAESDPLLRF